MPYFICCFILFTGICFSHELYNQQNAQNILKKNTDINYDAMPVAKKTTKSNPIFLSHLAIYEPWYIIPTYYSLNKLYSNKLQQIEVKAQISFGIEALDHVLCNFCSLSFEYTQKLYLQMYNGKESSPMRDIDFSPQLSFNYKKPLYLSKNGFIDRLSISYRHISNGETERVLPEDFRATPRSKALDRIMFAIRYKNRGFCATLRIWAILNMLDGKHTNPDINNYIGYGDIKLSYQYHNHLFEFYLNNIINNYFSKEYWNFKGQLELNYSYGISKKLALFVQYVVGHGDSLYEYNLPVNRIGIGVRFRDF